jgi:hypothetical protein
VSDAFPVGGCRLQLGMESQFFVEAKSFCFSMVKLAELRVEEKRKGFSGVALLGTRCTVVDGGIGVEKSWDRGFRQIF